MILQKIVLLLSFIWLVSSGLIAQESQKTNPFDFGRMWTFEQAPTEWFNETYDMNADQAWFDDVRKSALKFASWCSASFVSPNGLIMTNHHCSRDVSIAAQNDGENFDDNGFYAQEQSDERRVNEVFVEQLIMVENITDEVLTAKSTADSDAAAVEMEQKTLEAIKARYAAKADWKDLRLQTVSFYSGGKYSLYGYKKFTDIRLVLIPENDLGFYGGDPDNFTYPRYNLDCTFWRAYDDEGKPLDTSENYYKFNIDGIEEGTPVFVVGNPGRTERYRTIAQLEFDRDYRFKHLLKWLTNRRDLMQSEYDLMTQDPSKTREAQDVLSTINNLSNSIKAYNGIMGGLHNPKLMGRKSLMEQEIKSNSEGLTYWDDLDKEYDNLEPHAWAVNLLGASSLRGNVLLLMHESQKLLNMINSEAEEEEINTAKESLVALSSSVNTDKDKVLIRLLLDEIKEEIYPGDNTLQRLLDGKSIEGFVSHLFNESKLLKSESDAKKLTQKNKKYKKSKDPLLVAANVLISRYAEASSAFQSSSPYRKSLESKIANQAFNVIGSSLPPDATFTLRISDGVVKGYEYNGTVAPINTTYFGLYDRHYANDKKFPWSLPEKWTNPPFELLQSPLNFVSTNDIIGGNSGSAIINKNGEAVGLIFDGNIESLPGNFIFDEEHNRSVSVHAGGIYAAMKYIYKADRIVKELLP